MADQMKRAYLFAGSDSAKLSATLARLRTRAEREGGPGALETFGGAGGGPPDADALAGSIPAMSLTAEHRYLLADGVDRWKGAQVSAVAAALAEAPEAVTVVLVSRGAPPKGLADAVEGSGGDVISFDAPSKRDLPAWIVSGARERGFTLNVQAARSLAVRIGDSTERLSGELDRLALWAGPDGTVDLEDVERMTSDTSERAGWALADAIVSRDLESAVGTADVLMDQGAAITPLVYGMASRLRSAYQAAVAIDAGTPASQVEAALPMAPYPAKMLVRSVQGVDSTELSAAIGAVADLEWWTRGGSDYTDEVALTLSVGRAARETPDE
jgi:DNA polymerase III delta subunit